MTLHSNMNPWANMHLHKHKKTFSSTINSCGIIKELIKNHTSSPAIHQYAALTLDLSGFSRGSSAYQPSQQHESCPWLTRNKSIQF